MNLHELFVGSADHHPHNNRDHSLQSHDINTTTQHTTITSQGIQCLTSLSLLYKLHIYRVVDNKGAFYLLQCLICLQHDMCKFTRTDCTCVAVFWHNITDLID